MLRASSLVDDVAEEEEMPEVLLTLCGDPVEAADRDPGLGGNFKDLPFVRKSRILDKELTDLKRNRNRPFTVIITENRSESVTGKIQDETVFAVDGLDQGREDRVHEGRKGLCAVRAARHEEPRHVGEARNVHKQNGCIYCRGLFVAFYIKKAKLF